VPRAVTPDIAAADRNPRAGTEIRALHLARRRILDELGGTVPLGQFESIAIPGPRRPGKSRWLAFEPPEFAIRCRPEVDAACRAVGEIADKPNTSDPRTGVENGVPLRRDRIAGMAGWCGRRSSNGGR
jgi:hypothetical protein